MKIKFILLYVLYYTRLVILMVLGQAFIQADDA